MRFIVEPGTFSLFMYHRDGGTGVRIGPAPPPQPGPDAQGPPPPQPTNKMGAVVSPDVAADSSKMATAGPATSGSGMPILAKPSATLSSPDFTDFGNCSASHPGTAASSLRRR